MPFTPYHLGIAFLIGIIFYYSYTRKIYPNNISQSISLPSQNYNINNKIKPRLDYKIYQLKFKSIMKKGFDKIIVFQENNRSKFYK